MASHRSTKPTGIVSQHRKKGLYLQDLQLPHELFHALFTKHPETFKQHFMPGGEEGPGNGRASSFDYAFAPDKRPLVLNIAFDSGEVIFGEDTLESILGSEEMIKLGIAHHICFGNSAP